MKKILVILMVLVAWSCSPIDEEVEPIVTPVNEGFWGVSDSYLYFNYTEADGVTDIDLQVSYDATHEYDWKMDGDSLRIYATLVREINTFKLEQRYSWSAEWKTDEDIKLGYETKWSFLDDGFNEPHEIGGNVPFNRF